MFRLAFSSSALTNSLSVACRRLNTFSAPSSGTFVNPILFSLSSADQNKATYKCPEKTRNFKGIVGDENTEKNPIFDFLKTDIAVCTSNLNNTPQLVPEIIKRIQNEAIITSIMYEQNKNKSVELPTHQSMNQGEKKADYYKHKDPNRFTHLLWVRHRAMKKHQRNKWRKNNLAMIKRRLLERNIAKEKLFRAELLGQIREAENFDPKVYVENILHTIDNVPKAETHQERYERYRDLIRKNRTATHLIRPKFEE